MLSSFQRLLFSTPPLFLGFAHTRDERVLAHRACNDCTIRPAAIGFCGTPTVALPAYKCSTFSSLLLPAFCFHGHPKRRQGDGAHAHPLPRRRVNCIPRK